MQTTMPPPQPTAGEPAEVPRFARSLTLLDVFCLGINAIIGSGIFLFPGKLATVAGPDSIFAFLVCGLLLITVALCYAELGSIYRRNGGAYVYAREAFGPAVGFGVGWVAWVTAVFSWAAVANAISAYMAYFHPAFEQVWLIKIVACGIIIFFGAINYVGIKMGALTVNIFTLAKLVPLTLFVLVGLPHISGTQLQPLFALGAGTFGHAVFLALWPLQGFETTPVAAGETRTPERDIPLAAVGSLLFATLFYTLIQVVAVGSFPGLAGSEKPLADAARAFFGPVGGTLMAVGAVISMTGYCAGNALGSPRYLEPLAADRSLPAALADPHLVYLTPWRSIFLTTAISAVMALFLNFDQLVDISNLAVISQYLATCMAVLWLRRTRPELPRPFRIPLGPVIPIAGCLVSLWLVKQVQWPEVLFCGITVAVGFLLGAVYREGMKDGRADTGNA